MSLEMEKIAGSLKGIASILLTMSEVQKDDVQWNEWALVLLHKELSECIEKLEAITYADKK